MIHRRFLAAGIGLLLVLTLLAAWFTFSPVLSIRSRTLEGKTPVQVGISGRLDKRAEAAFSRLFDKVSFGMITAVYIALNVALPLAAQIR